MDASKKRPTVVIVSAICIIFFLSAGKALAKDSGFYFKVGSG
ncbi:hypothetical protein [Candidatus Scalindua japonica]|nr:hypothetical protein [Candidatus Scalindua japonica]